MPEQFLKVPRSVSPVAGAGAGDISERELSRERHKLQTTPPARLQPVHPKKQLFLTPVNKFTAKWCTPSPNLARIRSCLDEYKRQDTPIRPVNKTKALSMEDLTPTKRIKIDKKDGVLPVLRSPGVHGAAEQMAAAKICRFMMMVAWRRRREDVRCLRRTLETQVSYSERLRIQISTLKSLLDSDNAKVRLAMRELERLKQLLKEKEIEKSVLEREKSALEDDVCAAEDRASEMSIGWRNCRNELDGVRAAAAACERALALERAAAAETRNQRDHAYDRLSMLEADLAQHESLLLTAETEVAELRRDADERRKELEDTSERLRCEQEARERCALECRALGARVSIAAQETESLRAQLDALRAELGGLRDELRITRDQLDWWPRPLTKSLSMLEADLAQHESLLLTAETEVAELRRDADERRKELEDTSERLRCEQEARERCALECRALGARVSIAAQETESLRAQLDALRAELGGLRDELRITRDQLDWWPRPLTKSLSMLEADLAQHESLLLTAETEVAELRRDADERRKELEDTSERLRCEQEARERCALECRALGARVSIAAQETESLRAQLDALRAELGGLRDELRITRDQLDWWPRPLTKMLGAARSWFSSKSVPEAVLWNLIPARHGC